jgi:hypothetical protein
VKPKIACCVTQVRVPESISELWESLLHFDVGTRRQMIKKHWDTNSDQGHRAIQTAPTPDSQKQGAVIPRTLGPRSIQQIITSFGSLTSLRWIDSNNFATSIGPHFLALPTPAARGRCCAGQASNDIRYFQSGST